MDNRRNPTKGERLDEFMKRLNAAPPAATLEEAFALICGTLNRVEDELTDIPYNQATSHKDGRLYPPQWEYLKGDSTKPTVKRYRHLHHRTYLGANGAIEIIAVETGRVVFSKPGGDGKGVWQ